MLSRVLLLLTAGELLLYSALALRAGHGYAAALGLAMVGHLSLLAGLVVFSYLVAWPLGGYRPPQARIGPVRAVRGLLREIVAMVVVYSWLQPLAPWLRRPPRHTHMGGGADDLPPVILVHGFLCNSGYWWWLRRYLGAAGFRRIYSVELEPLLVDIDELGDALAARVQEVRARTAASRVLLVGHSMGGLVIRAYLRHPPHAAAVQGVVTLAAPHQGSKLAWLAIGRNGAQMRSDSVWLRVLAADEQSAKRPSMVSIFSWHDNLVAPHESAVLPGAAAVGVPEIGHLAVGFSARVAALVVEYLRAYASAPTRLRPEDAQEA